VAEFQWWLLIVGLVAGGGLVAVVLMDGARRDADVAEDEREAEATWISSWLAGEGRAVDRSDVEAVLRAHGEYLTLPPPDRLERVDAEPDPRRSVAGDEPGSADRNADRPTDDVRHDGRGGADEDLASA
jgi:hypothetical protein